MKKEEHEILSSICKAVRKHNYPWVESINPIKVIGRDRWKEVAECRHLYRLALRDMSGGKLTYEAIAHKTGSMSHNTVVNSCYAAKLLLAKENQNPALVAELLETLPEVLSKKWLKRSSRSILDIPACSTRKVYSESAPQCFREANKRYRKDRAVEIKSRKKAKKAYQKKYGIYD